MKTPFRISPIHDSLQKINATWQEVNGMPCITAIAHNPETPLPIGIADFSYLTRFGVKGANAATWLAAQEIPIPTKPNTWCPISDSGLIARLGMNEFLVEDGFDTAIAPQLAQNCQNLPPKVYPVLRQDLAIALCGAAVPDLLRQTCSIHFQALNLNDNPVLLTTMIGVTVTIIPGEQAGQPIYRIWCDGTFGNYFWCTLITIAEELGGGAIGINQICG